MRTVTIQIGNSDDKLTQVEWSGFVDEMRWVLSNYTDVHFGGGAPADSVWQNHCWVVEIEDTKINRVQQIIKNIRTRYQQDSVAWTEGETVFV